MIIGCSKPPTHNDANEADNERCACWTREGARRARPAVRASRKIQTSLEWHKTAGAERAMAPNMDRLDERRAVLRKLWLPDASTN